MPKRREIIHCDNGTKCAHCLRYYKRMRIVRLVKE